jgi:hypothetical protein
VNISFWAAQKQVVQMLGRHNSASNLGDRRRHASSVISPVIARIGRSG